MKETGISWVPFIPDQWNIVRLKDVVRLQSGEGITSDSIDDIGDYPVFGGNGLRGYTDHYTNEGNHVLIGRQGALCGNINYANGKFFASEHAVVVYPQDKNENTTWLGETLRAANLNRLSASAAQPGLAVNVLNIQSIPYPPKEIRERIGEYLDEKLSIINGRIAILEKQRNAYARLKKSIIHQAVTRGLNPNISLKDSGVEWIGMIPEHWELHRFKSIFTECKSVTETGQEDLLSVSEYYGVARRIDKMEDGEYESRADSLVGYKVCKKDDLVINIMLAWKRGLGFSDFDGIVSPAYAVYRGKNIAPHYFHYLMRTDMYVAEYKRNSKGIIDSRLRMYTDRFNNIMAIVPPFSEQQAIAAYLDEKCSEIDAATENIGKQIDAMKRLKRALINEVVTGQRAI